MIDLGKNRYGSRLWIDDGGVLRSDHGEDLEYMRVIYTDDTFRDDSVGAIDPPGGPFLSIGDEIAPGKVITAFEPVKAGGFRILIGDKENGASGK